MRRRRCGPSGYSSGTETGAAERGGTSTESYGLRAGAGAFSAFEGATNTAAGSTGAGGALADGAGGKGFAGGGELDDRALGATMALCAGGALDEEPRFANGWARGANSGVGGGAAGPVSGITRSPGKVYARGRRPAAPAAAGGSEAERVGGGNALGDGLRAWLGAGRRPGGEALSPVRAGAPAAGGGSLALRRGGSETGLDGGPERAIVMPSSSSGGGVNERCALAAGRAAAAGAAAAGGRAETANAAALARAITGSSMGAPAIRVSSSGSPSPAPGKSDAGLGLNPRALSAAATSGTVNGVFHSGMPSRQM